jgi:hypothetical protein
MRVDASDVTGPLLGLLALLALSFWMDDPNDFRARSRELLARGLFALLIGAGLQYFVGGIDWELLGGSVGRTLAQATFFFVLFVAPFALLIRAGSEGEVGFPKAVVLIVLVFFLLVGLGLVGLGVVGTVVTRSVGNGITLLRRLIGV